MALEDDLRSQLRRMGAELARRAATERRLDQYYDGDCPLPEAIVTSKLTKAYRLLMPMAEAPWGSLVVDSVTDRLEVTGISSDDDDVDGALWGVWQDNALDAESRLAHNAAVVSGRAFALIWPNGRGEPEITYETGSQMIVEYREGSRRERQAAMRQWVDDDGRPYATLYRPEAIYKFIAPKGDGMPEPGAPIIPTSETRWIGGTGAGQAIRWERREVPGEPWPLANPYGIVNVVELPVNRRLKPGRYGFARGEFAKCTGLLDRINLLTFLGLVVAFWLGFPLRGVIGNTIMRDDENNPIAPFNVGADELFQLENPDAKLAEYKAADRSNLSIYAELDQLATITHTPRHYFPLQQGMSNLSADAIRASEGGLVAKIPTHKSTLGEGHEETLRVAGLMLPSPVQLSQRAELQWSDHETRSLAERADAALKLKDILPQTAILEHVLNATAEQIARWQADRAQDAMTRLLDAAMQPAPAPAPSLNGGG